MTRYAIRLALAAAAVSAAAAQTPTFAPPVRVKAGEAFLGGTRMFPSPVFHDIDGDGRQDIVVGDLMGRLTFARRVEGAGVPAYEAEAKVLDAKGEQVNLQNW